jgi:tetratricopeptide (TPR) repeat protein
MRFVALSALTLAIASVTSAYAETGTLADLENRAPIAPVFKTTARLSAIEEARINNQLYDRMMQMARKSREPAVINAYLELARKLKSNMAEEDEVAELKSKTVFYEDLLTKIPASEQRDDFFYELASSHDKLGQTDRAVALLKQMLQRFPDTRYASEAYFRIAEYDFSQRRFADALQSYQRVLKEDGDQRYWQQAQYQLAWAYYKDGRFEDAIAPFERLIASLQEKQKTQALSKGESLRLADSYRTLSLVFVQLGGAPALAKHYNNKALTPDEVTVYRAVTERYREQKQPFDVAQTFENFIQRHPNTPETAQFNSELIQVYKNAGFAKDIIRAKSEYIQRFDTNSEYFQQANPELQASLRPELKANLDDLARHYHAIAQGNKSKEDYLKAAELYRKQFALATEQADQIRIQQSLAEALYSGGEFVAAIAEFEKLAYGSLKSTTPAEAGYFILLAYQARMKQLPDAEKLAWLDQQKQSSLQFADAFPTDKNAAPVLLTLTGQYLDREAHPVVVELATKLQTLPNLSDADRKTARILVANSQFDLKAWPAAEQAYRQVLTLPNLSKDEQQRYQNQLAASLYRQAEQAQRNNDFATSSQLYQQASDTTLDAKVKVDAAWRSAMVVGEVATAVPLLQAFYAKYGNTEQAEGIPERIVAIQNAEQNWTGAAQTYLSIYQRDLKKRPDNALVALWLAADSERKAAGGSETARKTPASAAELALYYQYLAEPKADFAQTLEASERIYQDAVLRQDMATQQKELKRQLGFANKLNSAPTALQPRLRYFAARALTLQDQAIVDQYRTLKITQPLKDSIARKQAALQKVIASQEAILNLKVADFITQAQFNLGDSFAQFYQGIKDAPIPEGLDELATEQYQIAIDEQIEPLREKALEWHKANAKLAVDPDVPLWDRFVAQSFDALATLSSGRYARPLRKPTIASNDAQLTAISALLDGKLAEQALKNTDTLIAARQADPQAVAQAQLFRGLSLIQLGRFKEADQLFTQVAQAQPKNADALYLQGVTRDLYLNQPQPALDAYVAYLATSPDDKAVQKWVNLLQKQLGQPLTKFNQPAAPAAATTDAEPPAQTPTPVENPS